MGKAAWRGPMHSTALFANNVRIRTRSPPSCPACGQLATLDRGLDDTGTRPTMIPILSGLMRSQIAPFDSMDREMPSLDLDQTPARKSADLYGFRGWSQGSARPRPAPSPRGRGNWPSQDPHRLRPVRRARSVKKSWPKPAFLWSKTPHFPIDAYLSLVASIAALAPNPTVTGNDT
jgi:hypothetical protein